MSYQCMVCQRDIPDGEIKCPRCGFVHIPAIDPTPQFMAKEEKRAQKYKAEHGEIFRFSLESLDDFYVWIVPEGRTIIGSENEMAGYLSGKPYVSRRQAELNLDRGRLMIENLSRTNYTYINNTKTTGGVIELHDGDIIGLGGNEQDGKRQEKAAYFTVRISFRP